MSQVYGKTISVAEGIAQIEEIKRKGVEIHEVPTHFVGEAGKVKAQPAEKDVDSFESGNAKSTNESGKLPDVSDYLNGKIRIRWNGVYNR